MTEELTNTVELNRSTLSIYVCDVNIPLNLISALQLLRPLKISPSRCRLLLRKGPIPGYVWSFLEGSINCNRSNKGLSVSIALYRGIFFPFSCRWHGDTYFTFYFLSHFDLFIYTQCAYQHCLPFEHNLPPFLSSPFEVHSSFFSFPKHR